MPILVDESVDLPYFGAGIFLTQNFFHTFFLVIHVQHLQKELALKKAGDESVKDPELDDSKIQETWPMASDKTVIGKIHLGGVEEENKEDSKLLR